MERSEVRQIPFSEKLRGMVFLNGARREIGKLVSRYSLRPGLVESLIGNFNPVASGQLHDSLTRDRENAFDEELKMVIWGNIGCEWKNINRAAFTRWAATQAVIKLEKRWRKEKDASFASSMKLRARKAMLFAIEESKKLEGIDIDQNKVAINYTGMSPKEVQESFEGFMDFVLNPPLLEED